MVLNLRTMRNLRVAQLQADDHTICRHWVDVFLVIFTVHYKSKKKQINQSSSKCFAYNETSLSQHVRDGRRVVTWSDKPRDPHPAP